MKNCNNCEFWKAISNKRPGVRIPGGFGKCVRDGGHCNPAVPRGGIGGAKSQYRANHGIEPDS